jgi:acyl-CoA synthetase (AMP-forming)/AMP-acid ligase II
MHVGMLLEMVAEGDPDRVVVGSSTGDGLRAAQLLERSRQLASRFVGDGVQHVAYFGLNSDTLPVVLFGAALAGVPFVPMNYRSTDDQVQRALQRIAPALVVAAREEWPRLQAGGADNLVDPDDLLATAAEGSASAPLPAVDADDIAILLFTSGTTGEPKVAILRHRHLVSYILGSVEFLGCDPSEAQLISVPPYHIAGISSVLSSLFAGRRIVYLRAFDPEDWVRTGQDEHVTHAMVVPTMLGRILPVLEAGPGRLSTLRHLAYGGGRMPAELVERALVALPDVDFVNAYGLTETSSTIAMLTPDDHRVAMASAEPAVRSRLSSVGRPLPSLEVEVRDEQGQAVPAGTKGEIWVRGDQVGGEYAGQDSGPGDGWFRTKDGGYFDHEGYLYVEGRLDDVIVRGAENISPGEIEDVIGRHPAVAEVAVVGVPDTEWGEAIAAVLVLQPGLECSAPEVQEWVRQHLRSSKTPSVVVFRPELPYNSTGKLLRRVLREELAAAG